MASGSSSAPNPLEIESAHLIGEEARGAGQLEVPGRPGFYSRAVAHGPRVIHSVGNQQLRGFQTLDLRRQGQMSFGLRHSEAPRREIQPGESEPLAVARDRSQQRLLPFLEKRLVRHGAGGDDAHHLAFHRAL